MDADERTSTLETEVGRWDVFCIGLQALVLHIFSVVVCSLALHAVVTLSYVLVTPPEIINEFILDRYFISIIVFTCLYGLFSVWNISCWAIRASQKDGVLGRHVYTCREDGFSETTDANQMFARWSSLRSVSARGKSLFVVLPANLTYVIRARDVTSPLDFKEFADLAVKRFKKARENA